MTDQIIGRDTELSVVRAWLDRPIDGPRALLLEGEAGIGKSTVWLAALGAARERSLAVHASRPAETEQTLPNVVLGDLLGEIAPVALAALPAPRRHAVEAALLLRDRAGPTVDARALGVAVLTLLPMLANGGPLVIAIDDDQWMDASSGATLDFALRRSDHPILLLISRRTGIDAATRLEETMDGSAIERLHVGPLSVGAVQGLLHRRIGSSFARPVLIRIHEASGGNPFYALELARAHISDPARDVALPLALPASLNSLLAARLDTLSPEARRALVLVAAHGRMPAALLPALGIGGDAIQGALKAGVIQRSSAVISFTHPLLASAVYEGATDDDRRAAHRRLATAIDDPILRGRHLALGAEDQAEDIAATLETTARIARDRGLPIAAAELLENALRLTPWAADDDRHRRAIATIGAQIEAGDGSRARAISAEVLARAPAGVRRAEALVVRSEFEHPQVGLGLLAQALAEAAGAPALEAAIHARLGEEGRMTKGRAWSEQHARASLLLAEQLDDDALRAAALAALAPLQFDRGDPDALQVAERAHSLARRLGDPAAVRSSILTMALLLTWSGRPPMARAWLEHELEQWRDRDEHLRSQLHWNLTLVEIWAGRWDVASDHAEKALEVGLYYGFELPQDYLGRAILAVHRGEFDLAREHVQRVRTLLQGQLLPAFPAVLGISELWSGRAAAALPHFMEAETTSDARDMEEANMRWWRAEYVEALLQAGDIESAKRLLDAWNAAAASISRDRVTAQITRCQGLLAAASGDLAGAAALLGEAVDRHLAVGDPFGRARALLALGGVRRRDRQKRTARLALESALAVFETLGAASWAAAARDELGKFGGRRRIEGLSPSELAVAALVAEGRTNREIASALFLGERTVGGHLTRIYAKLGLRSRTELARSMPRSAAIESEPMSKVERS